MKERKSTASCCINAVRGSGKRSWKRDPKQRSTTQANQHAQQDGTYHWAPADTPHVCATAVGSLASLPAFLFVAVSYLLWRAALGEVCGTFLLIFVACGTPIVSNHLAAESTTATNATSPLLTIFINNFTVALTIIALTYSLSSVSGAHLNPAVTFALWTSHHTSLRKLAIYVLAQLMGAMLALLTLVVCYNCDPSILSHTMVGRRAEASLYSVFLMELLLTFTLIFVIMRVSFDNIEAEKRQTMQDRSVIGSAVGLTIAPSSNARLGYAPITIGLLLLTLGVVGGGVSGSSMNPVRYMAPALVNGQWDVWMVVYVLGELSGACLAIGMSQVFDATGRLAEKSAGKAAEMRQLLQPVTGASILGGTAPAINGGLSVNAPKAWTVTAPQMQSVKIG